MKTRKIFKAIRRFEKGLEKSKKALYGNAKDLSIVIDDISISLDSYIVAKCRVCFKTEEGWRNTDFEVNFSADSVMSVQYYMGLIDNAIFIAESE